METKAALNALGALAQNTRLAIFRHLVEIGPVGANPGDIVQALNLAPGTLSFHLKELAHAGLIESEQEGRYIRYSVQFETMQALLGYLNRNCCGGDPSKCAPAALSKRKQRRLKVVRA